MFRVPDQQLYHGQNTRKRGDLRCGVDVQAADNQGGNVADVNVTYSLSGADAASFTIDPTTGQFKFVASPNFEPPTDLGGGASLAGNNVYDIIVTDSDVDNNKTTKAVAITVTDLGSDMSLDFSSFLAVHGQVASIDINGTGANTLKLSLSDVLSQPELSEHAVLKVDGGNDDQLTLTQTAGWSQMGTSVDADVSYNMWQHTASEHQVLISQHLQVL